MVQPPPRGVGFLPHDSMGFADADAKLEVLLADEAPGATCAGWCRERSQYACQDIQRERERSRFFTDTQKDQKEKNRSIYRLCVHKICVHNICVHNICVFIYVYLFEIHFKAPKSEKS